MMSRFLRGLFCLTLFAIAPLAGCTPPASEDVHGTYASYTGAGGCCPMTTAGLGDGLESGLPIEIDVTPITTAGQ